MNLKTRDIGLLTAAQLALVVSMVLRGGSLLIAAKAGLAIVAGSLGGLLIGYHIQRKFSKYHGDNLLEQMQNWWALRKYRKTIRRTQKSKLRAHIFRKQRIRLQTIYPDRETLPLSVWLREFARHCWDSAVLKYYPLPWLRKRASGEST